MLKDKLEIFIITYNRRPYLEKTLETIFADGSPIKDFDIKILDNNSTDDTGELCQKFAEKHKNLTYIKNHRNVGLSGNICKAIESASKEYFWILCDNDELDFSAWNEVEQGIEDKKDLILVCRDFVDAIKHSDAGITRALSYMQGMFLPSCIYKTSHLSDNLMSYMMNEIPTVFPHMSLAYTIANNNGNISILTKSITSWTPNQDEDYSYDRNSGSLTHYSIKNGIHNIALNFLNSLEIIKDELLRTHIINIAINNINYISFNRLKKLYKEKRISLGELLSIYSKLDKKSKFDFLLYFIFGIHKKRR